MGIDPGTNKMGYGVISVSGRDIEYLTMGYIDLSKFADHYLKLRHIHERMCSLCESYKPDEVAFEAPFFGENVQSMLKLGRAQGVAIAAASLFGASIEEYAPRKIKVAITGNGAASKEQVANMLKVMLKLDRLPSKLDATDGLAAAVCHHLQSTGLIIGKTGSKNNWDDFIKNNPNRVLSK